MALTKEISYDHTISENGTIFSRQITRIMEDGKQLSKFYHRVTLAPGDKTDGQDERTIKLANAIHTPTVVTAYKDKIKEKII